MGIKEKKKDFHFVISGTPEITIIDHLKFFQTFGNVCINSQFLTQIKFTILVIVFTSLAIYCKHTKVNTDNFPILFQIQNVTIYLLIHLLVEFLPFTILLYYNNVMNFSKQLYIQTCDYISMRYKCKFLNDNVEKFSKEQKVNRSLSLPFRGWHCLDIRVQWSQWAKGNRDFHYELVLDKHLWRSLVPVIPEDYNKDKSLK